MMARNHILLYYGTPNQSQASSPEGSIHQTLMVSLVHVISDMISPNRSRGVGDMGEVFERRRYQAEKGEVSHDTYEL